MKMYLVIALSVGGLNGKIFHSGDKIPETSWKPGRAEELVKQGFLKAIDELKKPLPIEAFEVSDIKRNLTNIKVEFGNNMSKQELYDLWLLNIM